MQVVKIIAILASVAASFIAPPVRHYDFVSSVQFSALENRLSFTAFNETYSLSLEKNLHLILPDTTLQIHNALTGEEYLDTIIAYPYYGVLIRHDNLKVGWARILFHSDPYTSNPKDLLFDGSFSDLNGIFHLNTVDYYRDSRRDGEDINIVSPLSREPQHRTSKLIIFKDVSDGHQHSHSNHLAPVELPSHFGCGTEPSHRSSGKEDAPYLKKRQSAISTSNTCFGTTKRGVAVDCVYTQNFGGPPATLLRIISDWNQASQVYEQTFNIQLAVSQVKIMQGCGDFNNESLPWNLPCSDSFQISDRLSAFSVWRGAQTDSLGLWHLLTKCNSGPSVGIAWLNTLCTQTSTNQMINGLNQFVSGVAVSSIVPVEWKVVAHEIGHNFGAIHDCTSNMCPYTCDLTNAGSCNCCPCASQCDLMHPTDNSVLSQFSPCSVSFMCLGITDNSSCLLPASNIATISANVCGNGVTEPGEDCDCGAACANDNCCNGATCKFQKNAKCDDRTDECCSSCQPKAAGVICRPSSDFCTQSSKCGGVSGICPASVTQADGTTCSITNRNNAVGTTCASGVCTSRQLQCQSLINRQSTGFQTVAPCPGQDNQCQLLCATSSGVCLQLNGNFIDGTPCAAGGFCNSGSCSGGSITGTIAYYFQSQPQIAIPVAITLAIVLFSLVSCCFRSGCSRCKRGKAGRTLHRSQYLGSGNRPIYQGGADWVDPALYNQQHQSLEHSSQAPPPVYGSNGSHGDHIPLNELRGR